MNCTCLTECALKHLMWPFVYQTGLDHWCCDHNTVGVHQHPRSLSTTKPSSGKDTGFKYCHMQIIAYNLHFWIFRALGFTGSSRSRDHGLMHLDQVSHGSNSFNQVPAQLFSSGGKEMCICMLAWAALLAFTPSQTAVRFAYMKHCYDSWGTSKATRRRFKIERRRFFMLRNYFLIYTTETWGELWTCGLAREWTSREIMY